MCIYGYAVTQWAAKMLMGWLLDTSDGPDYAISHFCEHHRCITVSPTLLGSHKSAGAANRDSDNKASAGPDREKGVTENIANSAILDMMNKVGH